MPRNRKKRGLSEEEVQESMIRRAFSDLESEHTKQEIEACKEVANSLFREGYIVGYVGVLSRAIYLVDTGKATGVPDEFLSILYSNRALGHLELQDWCEVEKDCTAALRLNADNMKAYYWRVEARLELGMIEDARRDLDSIFERLPGPDASQIAKNLRRRVDRATLTYDPGIGTATEGSMKPEAGCDYLPTAAHYDVESSIGTDVNVCINDDFTKQVGESTYYTDPECKEMKIDPECKETKVACTGALLDSNITDGRAMMCSILTLSSGNGLGMGDAENGKIHDLYFPPGFLRLFDGPYSKAVDMQRILEWTTAEGCLVVGTICSHLIKPQLGSKPKPCSEACCAFWMGWDFIKKDEPQDNQAFCQMAGGIPEVVEAMGATMKKISETKPFSASITVDGPAQTGALDCYIDPECKETKVACPSALLDSRITDGRAMMCSILTFRSGNGQDMRDAEYGKICDFHFPPAFLRLFDGPYCNAVSTWRIMERAMADGGLVIGTIITPKLGRTPKPFSEAYCALWMGRDSIKNNEPQGNGAFCQKAGCIPEVVQAKRATANKTGEQRPFSANITIDGQARRITIDSGDYTISVLDLPAKNCVSLIDSYVAGGTAFTDCQRNFPKHFSHYHRAWHRAGASSQTQRGYGEEGITIWDPGVSTLRQWGKEATFIFDPGGASYVAGGTAFTDCMRNFPNHFSHYHSSWRRAGISLQTQRCYKEEGITIWGPGVSTLRRWGNATIFIF